MYILYSWYTTYHYGHIRRIHIFDKCTDTLLQRANIKIYYRNKPITCVNKVYNIKGDFFSFIKEHSLFKKLLTLLEIFFYIMLSLYNTITRFEY